MDGGSTVEEVEIGGGGCGQDRVAGERVEMGLIDKLVVPSNWCSPRFAKFGVPAAQRIIPPAGVEIDDSAVCKY